MKEHLGAAEDHLPFAGEILGVILGLQIIKTMPHFTDATIFVDCQQAILELVRGESKHTALLDRFNRELYSMRPNLSRIHLVWVPGHHGVEMNRLVDKDAKDAAEGESSTTIHF
ncbi:hypothetical protein DFH07DRAFT_995219 [Mycena maculata]|uniref:RNase H type-1 domain-containing protein n=1 Tax=Mycena maculata TaxID=230809 RepID=A0AAD7HXC5_9AGAR|nr:hypothetical protein DFH07DRAFT_995219 [Mycena maculata]